MRPHTRRAHNHGMTAAPPHSQPAHPFRLDGRTALVTGAARGLGFEIALALAHAGAHVWLNGRDAAALAQAAQRIRAAVSPTHAAHPVGTLPFDIADQAARSAALHDRLVDQEIEHGLQVAGRRIYRLQHLGHCRLLRTGLVALGEGSFELLSQ